ncbi:MAG: hypothetical protein C5B48_15360 [Candidatus Rokuibacteriota bacterium]|nr:MAG: hypothetical protein C5B48_15360 [Candidatus Rokubacteria bacterium]
MRTVSAVGTGPVLVVTAVWLIAAWTACALGLVRALRPPLPQVLLVALTALLLALFWAPSVFRRWALSVDLRALVLIHVTRFVGIEFLLLYRRGELPYAFAVPGGWGDIAVAIGAILVSRTRRLHTGAGRLGLLVWNTAGLLDILFVVATASRLAMADPNSMRALLELPLCLLPTFLVPIIIATHVIVFARARAQRAPFTCG